jgi:hypothetical protein
MTTDSVGESVGVSAEESVGGAASGLDRALSCAGMVGL